MTIGVLLLLAAGIMNGSFASPMKRIRGWSWEHSWLIWALVALIVMPLLTVVATVSHPWELYRRASTGSMTLVFLFGLLWGISTILFGLGVARVGVAVTFALVLGISSILGSILPLVFRHPGLLLETAGRLTLVGLLLQVTGVAFCGLANHSRDYRRDAALPQARSWSGLVICCLSGLGAPLVNLALVFGSKVASAAEQLGTPHTHSLNAIWPLLFGGGFITNAGYCLYLIRRESAWMAFRKPPILSNFLLGGLMGVLWTGSNLVYGYGSRQLGPLGLVLGWPILLGCIVLTANTWGLLTGEWKGAPRTARLWMAAGTGALVAGVSVIGAAVAV